MENDILARLWIWATRLDCAFLVPQLVPPHLLWKWSFECIKRGACTTIFQIQFSCVAINPFKCVCDEYRREFRGEKKAKSQRIDKLFYEAKMPLYLFKCHTFLSMFKVSLFFLVNASIVFVNSSYVVCRLNLHNEGSYSLFVILFHYKWVGCRL